MSVKLKIVAAMAAALLIALVIGGVSLQSLHHIQGDVDALYGDGLRPIVAVGDIRTDIYKTRAAINNALLAGTPAANQMARKDIDTEKEAIDKSWSEYYPAHVGSNDEMAAAKGFLADQTQARDLLKNEFNLLDSGQHAQAVSFMLQTLGPALEKEATSIDSIVQINVQQGQEEYDDASARQHTAMVMNFIILGIGASFVILVAWLLAQAIMRPLLRARDLAGRISQGELNHQLVVTGKDELSSTLRALGLMDVQLAEVVSKVRDNASQVARATEDISAGNDSLSQRTQSQASSLEETAASMEEMSATVRQNADSANQAQAIAHALNQDASKGHQVSADAVHAMEGITQASQSVGEIAVLIDEIAFQTNLLALNAAVEAARAGDQGRGFSVVATEVRALAQRSAKAAKEIKTLIFNSTEKIAIGADLVRQTGQALSGIQTGAMKVSALISEIAAASAQQSAGIDQVNDAVTQLDQVTQENAALVEEASAASRQTMDLAQELMSKVAFFTVLDHPSVVGGKLPRHPATRGMEPDHLQLA